MEFSPLSGTFPIVCVKTNARLGRASFQLVVRMGEASDIKRKQLSHTHKNLHVKKVQNAKPRGKRIKKIDEINKESVDFEDQGQSNTNVANCSDKNSFGKQTTLLGDSEEKDAAESIWDNSDQSPSLIDRPDGDLQTVR